jgi:hypothetical protein
MLKFQSDFHTDPSRQSYAPDLVAVQMCFKYALLALFILLNSNSPLKAQLSPHAEISILTCAPGDELYSIFGHTAIRVSDPENNTDYVFNYGTFDFNTPSFYLKFIRGQLNYMLSVTTYNRFIQEYMYEERAVWEQVLNLDEGEKSTLFRALVANAEPENRFYHYHFFFDNCATRVRDMATKHVSSSVLFEIPEYVGQLSFRDAIARYLHEKPWTRLGLEIVLGQPTDNKVDAESVQFLPDYLMEQFHLAVKSDGSPVVNKTSTLLEFSPSQQSKWPSPTFWLWIICVVILYITWNDYKRGKQSKLLDVMLFSVTSLIGLLIVFLWFFTAHSVTGPNWHILWANPLQLLLLVAIYRKAQILIVITWLILAGTGVTLLFFWLLPQFMPLALIPVWLMIIVRILLTQWKHFQVEKRIN